MIDFIKCYCSKTTIFSILPDIIPVNVLETTWRSLTIFNNFLSKAAHALKLMTVSHGEMFDNFVLFYKQNLDIQTKNREIPLTLMHSERPKLYAILAFLSAKGLKLGNLSIFGKIGSVRVPPQKRETHYL